MRMLAAVSLFALIAATPAFANTSECAAEITAVIGAASTSGPVRLDGNMKTPVGDVAIKAEVVPPGNTHMITTIGGAPIEMIVIGKDSWVNADGAWMPMGGEMTMAGNFGAPTLGQLQSITGEQCLGAQTVDGVDLLAYTFDMSNNGDNSVNRVFADPATKRVVRIEADVTNSAGATSMVVSYEYDPSITVTAPL